MADETVAKLTDAVSRGRLTLGEVAGTSQLELDALFELAAEALDTGRVRLAAELLAGVVTLFPYDGRYWCAYGIALQRLGEPGRARAAYDAALVLGCREARCFLGEVMLYLGEVEAAKVELTAATKLKDPAVAKRAKDLLRWLAAASLPPKPVAVAAAVDEVAEDDGGEDEGFLLEDQPLPLADSELDDLDEDLRDIDWSKVDLVALGLEEAEDEALDQEEDEELDEEPSADERTETHVPRREVTQTKRVPLAEITRTKVPLAEITRTGRVYAPTRAEVTRTGRVFVPSRQEVTETSQVFTPDAPPAAKREVTSTAVIPGRRGRARREAEAAAQAGGQGDEPKREVTHTAIVRRRQGLPVAPVSGDSYEEEGLPADFDASALPNTDDDADALPADFDPALMPDDDQPGDDQDGEP